MHLTSLRAVLALGLGLASAVIGMPPAARAVDTTPVEIAIAVPITVPEGTADLLTAEQLASYTRASGTLTRQLDAVADRPVAIGIDPRIIVSIRVLGSNAPVAATAWLERLASATNEIFPLAYADADLTLATQSGASPVPSPSSLDFAIDPALFAAAPPGEVASSGPTSSPTPDPVVPTVPTTDDLFDWPYTTTGLAWPRDDTLVAADLPTLAASGFSMIVANSENVALASSSGSMASVGGIPVLVSDQAISAPFRAAARSQTPEQWTAAVAALREGIAAASRTQPGAATVFVTLDRSPVGFGPRLAEAITLLDGDPSASLIPLARALASPPSDATITDRPQDADRISQLGQLLEAEAAERRFATIATDPVRITSERRLELLALLSNAWVQDPTGWTDAAGDFITESVALRNSVALVQSSSLLLIADNGQFLPITVKNDLDQPVTVYLTVKPSSALLSIQGQPVEVVLDAGVQSKINVPVQSLSSGVVDIQVTLASAGGDPLGSPLHTDVNVQAGWETPVVIGVGVLVLLIFVVGIVRTVLRRRRPPQGRAADD